MLYFDSKGHLRLSDKARDAVPTYMVHYKVGEVVVADTELSEWQSKKSQTSFSNVDLFFQESKRTRKVGILYFEPVSRDFRTNWVAIEENGVIEAAKPYRDLHRDLSIIAKRLGVKPDKVRIVA